jgi:hypothetical protein
VLNCRAVTAESEVGFFSFTEITVPSAHHQYNEWHQLDHLPQQYEVPGITFGQRWVSTPACAEARAFEDGRLAGVHYMTLYLVSGPVAENLERFRRLGETLRAAGRFHEQRRARLSGPFAIARTEAADRVKVSARVVPFRPNLGVYVIVEPALHPDPALRVDQQPSEADSRGDQGEAAASGTADEGLGPSPRLPEHVSARADRLVELPGVAGVWVFASTWALDALAERLGWRPGSRSITVCYLDAPPLEVSPSISALVRDTCDLGGPPEFAGPLETIVPWLWGWFSP